MNKLGLMAAGIACAAIPGSAAAQSPQGTPHGSGETVTQIFARALPNVPGRSLVAVEVAYAPGGKSPPHHHAKSASVYAYVVSGAVRSQVEGEPVRVYRAGESFFETPGSHHVVGENASETEPAKLLAVFVVDADDKVLTIPDR